MDKQITLSDNPTEGESDPPVYQNLVTFDKLTQDNSIIKFIENNYPNTTIDQWNDWKWQIKNSITKSIDLINILGKKRENTILNIPENHLPFRITPYFASLLDRLENDHPLYKTIIPTINELYKYNDEEKSDPLDEELNSPVKNIIHKYPDRALFLVTGFCSTYCRYCTRSHMVSKRTSIKVSNKDWEEAFDYLQRHTEVRDVIISGGDPLTLNDEQLDYILSRLRSIKHIEIIRIGTKTPIVLPQRITPELVNILKKYHPLFMSIHFTHPDELSKETERSCNLLADGGIPLGSQSVLLKGVNDDVDIMKKLMHKLMMVRVRPYYLYSCDLIPGSKHFRSTIEKGLEIIKGLKGFTSGYACPRFIVDSHLGKIDISPNNIVSFEDGVYNLKTYNGEIIKYKE